MYATYISEDIWDAQWELTSELTGTVQEWKTADDVRLTIAVQSLCDTLNHVRSTKTSHKTACKSSVPSQKVMRTTRIGVDVAGNLKGF
eukprot:2521721-Amphidinium_carterae.1